MAEYLGVLAEVWPLVADASGIWLLSGDAPWSSPEIAGGSTPGKTVGELLINKEITEPVILLHSTSWRMEGLIVLTYICILSPSEQDHFKRTAIRIYKRTIENVAAELDTNLQIPITNRNVLFHALRHLKFLLESDSEIYSALDSNWKSNLAEMQPALAGEYGRTITFGPVAT